MKNKNLLKKLLEQEVDKKGFLSVSIFELAKLRGCYGEVFIDEEREVTINRLYNAVRPLLCDVVLPKPILKYMYDKK